MLLKLMIKASSPRLQFPRTLYFYIKLQLFCVNTLLFSKSSDNIKESKNKLINKKLIKLIN